MKARMVEKFSYILFFFFLNTNAYCTNIITSSGSDTLAKMMDSWSSEFTKKHPNVSFNIKSAGSSTAPPALINNESQLAPMSRKMKSKESSAFEEQFGYKPTAIRVALDALAIFVHKDNLIENMSLPQIDALFSETQKCGATSPVSLWSDLNVESPLGSKKPQLYGRNSKSGTYGFFKKKALCKGNFSNSLTELPSSEEIIKQVGNSINAVGYSGIGYKTPSVRAVPLSKKQSGPVFKATSQNASSGKYPLSRYLYIYINKSPDKAIDNTLSNFIQFILSSAGQKIVSDHGYIPVGKKVIQKDKKKLGL